MSYEPPHSNVPYDPLVDASQSPRLRSAYLDAPSNGSPHLTPGDEFGAPDRSYFDGTYNSNSAASSMNFRDSQHGSLAALRQNANYGYPPSSSADGYRDEDPVWNNNQLYEKDQLYAAPRAKSKRKLVWVLGILGLFIVIAGAVAAVYFTVIKKNDKHSSSSSSSSSNQGNSTSGNHNPHQAFVTSGGDGSVVTKDDGTTFIYNNTFGGYWVYDPANPLNNSARAQSYTPPLSEEWPWGSQSIYGVNLGGWLVIEPFITPSLYEPFYPNAVDEWTLHTLIQQRDGNLSAIEDHYRTFITEEDFAQVAAAGLNWVRIPLPFWAIEVYPGEPFLPKVCWTYFLKAIEWARKYGLRINLDLHSVPGSQNGWNHSGKMGEIDFLAGVMGIANAQRTMDYIRVIAEFISQPEYRNVVPFFGILNEPVSGAPGGFPKAAIQEFYAEAYRIVRAAGAGNGAGNGPYISIHEAYWGVPDWAGFLGGADRLALDYHPYLCFSPLSPQPIESFPPQVCTMWSGTMSTSMGAFGLTGAGEWSLAWNDCGLYVNQVGAGSRYEGTWAGNAVVGSCDQWNNYASWNQSTKDTLKQLGAATMDALGNWFFWTWKVGPSLATGKIEAPFWSYQLAIQEGWAVTDPRTSAGTCSSLGQTGYTFPGPLAPNQLGTASSYNVASLDTYAWPPDTVTGFESAAQAASLPRYTPTGPIPTLPIPTLTQSGSTPSNTANLGNGWNNASDQTLMAVPASGCTYPDPWAALTATIPNCGTN